MRIKSWQHQPNTSYDQREAAEPCAGSSSSAELSKKAKQIENTNVFFFLPPTQSSKLPCEGKRWEKKGDCNYNLPPDMPALNTRFPKLRKLSWAQKGDIISIKTIFQGGPGAGSYHCSAPKTNETGLCTDFPKGMERGSELAAIQQNPCKLLFQVSVSQGFSSFIALFSLTFS